MSRILLPVGITNHFFHKCEKYPYISCCMCALEWCPVEFSSYSMQPMKSIALYAKKSHYMLSYYVVC